MTSRAEDEAYVKSQLRQRMEQTSQLLVLVGESTRNLRKFVAWEIDLALERDIPIVVVNLNEERRMDATRCPVSLRSHCAVHVPFKAKAIKYALDNWPGVYRGLSAAERAKGWRYYEDDVYRSLGV